MSARQQYSIRHRGFTLLELLVVLVIGALLVALTPAALSSAMPGMVLKVEATDLAIVLRSARNRAISHGREVDVLINTVAGGYSVRGDRLHVLPSDLTIRVRHVNPFTRPSDGVWVSDSVSESVPLRFFPDGSAAGAIIELANDRSSYLVQIDWLLGEVSVRRGAADV